VGVDVYCYYVVLKKCGREVLSYRQVSISIEENLVESVDDILEDYPRDFSSRSDLFETALYEYLEEHYPDFLPKEVKKK